MPGEARLGDFVVMNCPHGGIGVVVSGSPITFTESFNAARIGDRTTCLICGRSGKIVGGSPKTIIDGFPGTRKGDSTTGMCDVGARCCPHGRSGTLIGFSATTAFDGF